MAVRLLGRSGRWRANVGDMYAWLGVTKLPAEAMPERIIQGARVYVKPSTSGGTRARRRCSHRVMVICTCGRHVPFGRLGQHKCKS